MRDFRKLNIWQQGIQLVKQVYELKNLLPAEEKFGLISQICRAAISIPSNIAEGCSRNSATDYKRFLEMAQGSAFELETHLTICVELNYIGSEKLTPVFDLLHKEQQMLNSLITIIKNGTNSERLKANS